LNEFALAIKANPPLVFDPARPILDLAGTLRESRCRPHLNDPGCVVGEHRHVLVACCVCDLGQGPLLDAMHVIM